MTEYSLTHRAGKLIAYIGTFAIVFLAGAGAVGAFILFIKAVRYLRGLW